MTLQQCSRTLLLNMYVSVINCFSLANSIQSIKQLPVELTALINDTTGTLIASHYVNPRTKIAVIFGTGCNAAYMENISDIDKIHDLGIDLKAQMAINCEWVRAIFYVLPELKLTSMME